MRIDLQTTFEIKLPDFYISRSVTIHAYIENASIGGHDIVLGLHYIQQLALIFDFKHYIVSWDDISAPMKKLGRIAQEELSFIDPQDAEAPGIQFATKRMEKAVTSDNYESYNYKSMILNYEHSTKIQQISLVELFPKHSSLFDGTLDKVPNFKANLELKPKANPFCARAYKIPIAKQEVDALCCIGVLEANVYSEWGLHAFSD